MTQSGYVCVLDTSVRPHFDAACSILRHEGIPFHLRETRTGLVPYVTRDVLRIFVPAEHAHEAGELMALLEQPAYPAYSPYRTFDDEDAEGSESAETEAPRDRTRGAFILLTLCALAVVAVTIGLALSYRGRLLQTTPRMSSDWAPTTPAVWRGR